MFTVLLALTILCGLDLIVGFVWLLASRGQTRRRSGADVGAEVFGQATHADEREGDVSAPLAGRAVFRGTGVKVEREVGLSYAEIKASLRQGRWDEAMPALLAMGGLTGLCAFGSLALLVRLEDVFVGVLIVAVVFYTLIRIWIGFMRA